MPARVPRPCRVTRAAWKSAYIATASLAEIGERNALLIAREVGKLIQRTFAGNLVQAPSDWTELGQAHKMVESATGRNKRAGVTVNVASGMNWSATKQVGEKPIIVVEAETVVGDDTQHE